MSTATTLAKEFNDEAKAALLGVLNEARAFVNSANSLLWPASASIDDLEVVKARRAILKAFRDFELTDASIVEYKNATFYDPNGPPKN